MLDALLRAKADVEETDYENGLTPIHVAAHGGHTEVVDALLRDKAGATATSERLCWPPAT